MAATKKKPELEEDGLEEPSAEEQQSAYQVLQETMAEIEALPPGEIRQCNVMGTTIVQVGKKLPEQVEPLLAQMGQISMIVPHQQVQRLLRRALATWGAQKQAEVAGKDGVTPRKEHYNEAQRLKKKAVKVLELAASDDPKVQQAIELVTPGSGYVDAADDLTTLHPHLMARRDNLIRRELMTAQEIDRMGVLGSLLLGSQDTSKAYQKARQIQNSAWTLFYNDYKEIWRHLHFLFYDDPSTLKQYARLYEGRNPKKGKNQKGEPPLV